MNPCDTFCLCKHMRWSPSSGSEICAGCTPRCPSDPRAGKDVKGPKSEARAARAGAHFCCGSCSPLEVESLRGRREAIDTHRRRAGSGSVFWPACVLETRASCSGIRNVKWPEVRLSLTPTTPLHPPAASKDPQPPFCVFGSQIQQLIQCMWAILKVLSLSPSSVEFHHTAQRLTAGLWCTYKDQCSPDPLGHNHMLRLFSSALLLTLIQHGCMEAIQMENCQTAAWELCLPG